LDDKHFYDHEIIGFKLHDTRYGEVGIVEQVIDNNVNPLIQVMNGEKEILIPFIDGLVQKVDRKAKTIHVTSPEGLIEMYMGE
jgi:16S rRNA processing protein RimM